MDWNLVMSGQSPPSIDWILMVLFTIAALTQYVAIAMKGKGLYAWRVLSALGWSLWSTRFWWAFLVGNDPVVPPVAAAAITFISCASILQSLSDSSCEPLLQRQN